MNSQWIEQALPKQSHRAERLFSFPFAIRCGFGFSFCRIENVLETDCGVVDITQRAIGVAETPCGSFDIVLFSCFCFPYSFYQFSKEGLMVECTARVQHWSYTILMMCFQFVSGTHSLFVFECPHVWWERWFRGPARRINLSDAEMHPLPHSTTLSAVRILHTERMADDSSQPRLISGWVFFNGNIYRLACDRESIRAFKPNAETQSVVDWLDIDTKLNKLWLLWLRIAIDRRHNIMRNRMARSLRLASQ